MLCALCSHSSLSHSYAHNPFVPAVTLTNYQCLSWILLQPHPECHPPFYAIYFSCRSLPPWQTITPPSAHLNVNSCIVDVTALQLQYSAEMRSTLCSFYCTVQTALKCYLRRHQDQASNCCTKSYLVFNLTGRNSSPSVFLPQMIIAHNGWPFGTPFALLQCCVWNRGNIHRGVVWQNMDSILMT